MLDFSYLSFPFNNYVISATFLMIKQKINLFLLYLNININYYLLIFIILLKTNIWKNILINKNDFEFNSNNKKDILILNNNDNLSISISINISNFTTESTSYNTKILQFT
jgi:hypothetical protein